MHYLQQPRYVTTKVSINRGMDKEDVVSIHTHTHTHTHTHNGILLDHKTEILSSAATYMEGITLNEISQTKKDKCCMSLLTHGI